MLVSRYLYGHSTFTSEDIPTTKKLYNVVHEPENEKFSQKKESSQAYEKWSPLLRSRFIF